MIRKDSVEHLRRSLDAIPEETEEERELRHLEDAGFTPHESDKPLYECWSCGAVVFDWERHQEWHHVTKVARMIKHG